MFHFTADVYLFAFMGASMLILLHIMLCAIRALKDLERYYIDRQQACDEINKMYLIRAFFHLLVTFVLFGNHYYHFFLLHLPANILTWHNIDRFFQYEQAIEPAEVSKQLRKCKLYALFFMLSYFLYMYLLAVKMYIPTAVIRLH